jgi:glycosyltransferase involved in cell wall biosynthesis
LNVLHVIPTYPPAWRYGGPMRSVHGLARAQAAAGDRVTVFTTNLDGPDELNVPLARAVRLDGIEVWYFPVASPRRLARSPVMTRELHGAIASFDVVHLHSVFLWPTQAVARACCRAGVPYVLSPRGMLVRDLIAARGRLRKTLWLALFERKTVRDAAAVIVSSELEAQELAALDLGAAYVEVVPNGLSRDDADGGLDVGAPPALPDDGRPVLLYLGRLSWKKGVDVAIRALAQLPGRPEARLAIAGNDDEGLRPRLEALAAELGVTERISFLGEVRGPAKSALLATARVLLMPSISENFGMAALEAMAAGVPVVLTPGVGLAAAAEEAGAAVACERTPQAFAAAITRLLAQPEVAREMGERGRRLAAERFSWPAIAAATRVVYECAIASARATAPARPPVRAAHRAW